MNSRILTIDIETVVEHYGKIWDKACDECDAPRDSAFVVFDPESKYDRRLDELGKLAKNMAIRNSNTVLITRENGESTYEALPVMDGQIQWKEEIQ